MPKIRTTIQQDAEKLENALAEMFKVKRFTQVRQRAKLLIEAMLQSAFKSGREKGSYRGSGPDDLMG